jgi:hypothetical protein
MVADMAGSAGASPSPPGPVVAQRNHCGASLSAERVQEWQLQRAMDGSGTGVRLNSGQNGRLGEAASGDPVRAPWIPYCRNGHRHANDLHASGRTKFRNM